jgi:mRNA-degrading endonuclease toxin of MazEF toxin-antitoxin module
MKRERKTPQAKRGGGVPKERRTFTLSPESIALLNDLSAARRGSRRRSVSSVLDDLLRALDKQRKRDAVDQAVKSFYDGLSPQDRALEKDWGGFSLAQFMDGPE